MYLMKTQRSNVNQVHLGLDLSPHCTGITQAHLNICSSKVLT